MADPAEFRPDELDRIEDALESLELADAVTDPSPAVAARLREYQQLLLATRDAMPLQEVPVGLLDGVLAEAQRAASTLEPAAVVAAPSWWTRFRRSFLVPVTALAGTAALVLFIARPDPNAEAIVDEAPSGAAAGKASAPATPAPADVDQSAAAAAPEPEPAVDAPEEGESEQRYRNDPTPTVAPGSSPAPISGENAKSLDLLGSASAAQGDDGQVQQKELRSQSADDEPSAAEVPGWDLVARADAAREAGDCRSAREDYLVATEDDAAAVRARAFAGLGLCAKAAGNTDEAEDDFARARDLDGSVSELIERDAKKPYRPSTKKAPRAKRKASSLDEKPSPFESQ